MRLRLDLRDQTASRWNLRALVFPLFARLADEKDSGGKETKPNQTEVAHCLLYTSDAADAMQCVVVGGRSIIK